VPDICYYNLMGEVITEKEWVTAKQVEARYEIKRSSLDRRVLEGKIVRRDDKPYGAKKGAKRYLLQSVKDYIQSLGNGLDKKTDYNYRYNDEKRYMFPLFILNKPEIYEPIYMD